MDEDFEKNLLKLECPFTWDMDDIDSTISTEYKPHDEEEELLLLKLMRIIMTVFVQSKEKADSETILKNLEDCENIMTEITLEASVKKLDFSIDAVFHVLQATSCHIFWKMPNTKERAKNLFKDIKSGESMDDNDRSTINACRSIGWSKYHTLGSEEAVEFIRLALKENPDCGLWHFILGKNLRRMRRDLSVGAVPTDDEKQAFLTAYEKSPNTVFGLFVAQMYRELRRNQQAVTMYEEVLRSKPKSRTVYLRLALGFVQLFKMELAKECLDKVAVETPEDTMYLHYRGHYHMKKKNFQEAAYYLKKAADMNNFPASREYVRCMLRMNAAYDPTDFLLSMIEKLKDLPEKQIQCLVIDAAVNFLRLEDVEKSLKYFSLAIEIDPQSQALQEYYSCFEPGRNQDVYQIMARDLFPLVEKSRSTLDETALETFDDLKNCYDEYQEERKQSVVKALSNMSTNEGAQRGRGARRPYTGRGDGRPYRGRGDGSSNRGRGDGWAHRGRGEGWAHRGRGEGWAHRGRGAGRPYRGRGDGWSNRGRGDGWVDRSRGTGDGTQAS